MINIQPITIISPEGSGSRRKRRGALAVALSRLFGGKKREAAVVAVNGAPAILTLLSGKLAAALLLGLGGVLALAAGVYFAARRQAAERAERERQTAWTFAERKKEELRDAPAPSATVAAPAPSALIGGSASLKMISGANAGKMSDPYQAAAAADKPAETEAKDAAEEPKVEDPTGGMLANMQQMTQSLASGKMPDSGFGKLSGQLGGKLGGLAGGQGMFAGVNQKFDAKPLSNQLLALQQARGTANGRSTALSASRRAMSAPGSRGGLKIASSGGNRRRLVEMNRAMVPTKGGDAEAGSAVQTREWSSGRATGGAGAGGSRGAPILGGPDGADAQAGLNPNEGLINSPRSQAPLSDPYATPKVGGKNKTPNQDLITAAQALIMAATILIMLSAVFAKAAESSQNWKWQLQKLAQITAFVALVAAVAALGIGIALMAKGQSLEGGVIAAVGTLLAVIAAIVWVNSWEGDGVKAKTEGAAKGATPEAPPVEKPAEAARPAEAVRHEQSAEIVRHEQSAEIVRHEQSVEIVRHEQPVEAARPE